MSNVNEIQFVPTPDDESAALNTLDLHKTAVADEKFREVLTCKAIPNETDEITLTSYQPNELVYHTSTANDRIAVFSEIYYPEGWHMTIDGEEQEIGRVDYVLRAAIIPAGEHTIRMYFLPDAMQWDKWCAALAILLFILSLALLIGWPIYQRKRVA